MGIQWHRTKNISRHKYMDSFSQNSTADSACADSKIAKAYEQAAKIREFEIGLYWKRAGYFWAFIVSIYTAFFSVQKEFYHDKCTGFTHGAIPLLVLSALGFFFCLAWLLSSKASKFWQKNWENHIDLLEDFVTGPLYKTYHAGASFSVSKSTYPDASIGVCCSHKVSQSGFIPFITTQASGYETLRTNQHCGRICYFRLLGRAVPV